MLAVAARNIEAELEEFVGQFYDDPLGFVQCCYPWPINGEPGPDVWQAQVLTEIGEAVKARAFDGVTPVLPIREAISSGHGIGKSALFAWLAGWLMSTRRNAKGTVTANTNEQLEKKTWAAIRHWTGLCVTAHWFEINSAIMYRKGARASWFCAPQSCAEENSEAFAGQHEKSSSSFYLFDEASAVPPKIWEVAEGGLTDGEPFLIAAGNPTRNMGKFHEAVFGARRDRWTSHVIDSRTCKFANKGLIAEWVQDYGEDSDFVRVRVRGLPPSASDLQFIDSATVSAAQTRAVAALSDDPLVCGLDLSRGGGDECVFRFRRGQDARSIPPIHISGQEARDSMKLVTKAADVLATVYDGHGVSMLFVDATGGSIGGPIADRLRQLGHRNVVDVQFGGESPDPKYANFRAYMWGRMRDALAAGLAIDKSPALEMDLTGPGYFHDKRDRLLLESKEQMKKRGLDSPDDGDALAMTFAQIVKPKPSDIPEKRFSGYSGGRTWMSGVGR